MPGLSSNVSRKAQGRFRLRLPRPSMPAVEDVAANVRAIEEQWNTAPWPYAFGVQVARIGPVTSIPAFTVTGITFDSVFDPNQFWAKSGNAGWLKIPPGGTGVYIMSWYCLWDTVTAVANPQLIISCLPPGATQVGIANTTIQGVTSVAHKMTATTVRYLAEGTVIFPNVYHQSAAARNLETWPADALTNPQSPYFSMWRVAVPG